MKVLILSEYFYPEVAAPCFRIEDHAKRWLQQGHEVTVVTCAPNFPRGKVFDGYRNRLYQEEWVDGVRVIRLWSLLAANKGILFRTLDYISFMLCAMFFFWRYPKFDVLLATSPPLFVSCAGFVVASLRCRPWVFEIRDLWPASIQAVGVAKGWPLRLMERLELFLYRRATRIISLTHSFKTNLISRGIDGTKIDVVTNGVDIEKFAPSQCMFDARQRLEVPEDSFLAGYVGTTGRAHGLETVVEAADLCRNRPDLHFLIMGEGAERNKLEQYAKDLELENITFADNVPHNEIPSYLSALDASIVHLRPDPLFKTVIPSKIFESMAMKVPVLMAVEGEGAEIIEAADCGLCIPSGDAQSMADALVQLAAAPRQARAMGSRGMTCVSERFNRDANAAAVIDSLAATQAIVLPAFERQRPELTEEAVEEVAPQKRAA